ncbi:MULTISPECIES: hypothetical protein [Bombella]|uniref:Uncharacterized protein n=2 Tax=Bombella TaxID=1654741 RepID=A0ABT3WK64_9PROT|nr:MULTISPECIES: hypothetical protein [Bombella]MCX5613652.1 hypothetical protein [Bombella saccharophila]MCX5619480.1 hypothetical protein [Bombella pollinis]
MGWLDWKAPPQRIAARMLWLAVCAGVVLGGAVGGFILWGIMAGQ